MRHRRLAPAALLEALAAAATACGATPVPSLVADVLPEGPPFASDADELFLLDFALTKRTYTDAEPIEGLATLSVLAPGIREVEASGGQPMSFGIVEVGGRRAIEPPFGGKCNRVTISQGAPFNSQIIKSGGFSANDPDAGFYVDFFEDPELHLPPGTWDITANASFSRGRCGEDPRHLEATIRIAIVPEP